MTEQQNPTADITADPVEADDSDRIAVRKVGKGPDNKPLYAGYDNTYLRFLGGTHPTEAKARDAAKAAAGIED